MSQIIASIRVSNAAETTVATVTVGECVLVDVLGIDGSSLQDSPIEVSINGIRGARQWLQPNRPGPFIISASARSGVDIDSAIVTLEVVSILSEAAAPPAAGEQVLLSARHVIGPDILQLARPADQPYRATFSVSDRPVFVDGLASGPGRTSQFFAFGNISALSAATTEQLTASFFAESHGAPAIPAVARTYRWDFGDGTTAVTDSPSADHDFESSLGPDETHRVFDVRVEYTDANGALKSMIRSLSVHNAYAICKERGVIVPRRSTSGFATALYDGFEGTVTVRNIEPDTITFTSRRVRPMSLADDDEGLYGPEEVLSSPVSVPAGQSVVIPVVVTRAQFPRDAIGFTVCLAGSSASGLPVRLETHFDVSENDRSSTGIKLGPFSVTHLREFRNSVESAIAAVVNPPDPVTQSDLHTHGHLDVEHGGIQVQHGGIQVQHGGIDLQNAGIVDFAEPVPIDGHVGVLPAATHSQLEAIVVPSVVDTIATHLSLHDSPQLLEMSGDGLSATTRLIGLAAASGFEARTNVTAAVALLGVDEGPGFAKVLSAGLLSKHLFDMIEPSVPAEGEMCDPDNVDAPEGWACQATSEVVQKRTPGRFLNARRGDIILSPGGMGMIGGMLMSVSPPQRYSHCGIMTKNYIEITHATGSGDRVESYPVGSILGDPFPTDGHRPDIVKYGWPGVISQTTEEAVNGSWMLDPETANSPEADRKFYEIKAFTPGRVGMSVNGAWEMVPALVIKPDPMQETPEIRATLRAVANTAHSQIGKSHYRNYCYTDPTIGLSETAPPEAGWAAGTFPAVCSSFLWLMLRRHGVHLEAGIDPVPDSAIEASDRLGGAQVNATTLDGLYLYTAAERRAAGAFLHNFLSNKVWSKAESESGLLGDLGVLFSDMADDVANQICNSFASDWTDTEAKDSDRWSEAQDSNAVSPDNILLWDGPGVTGLYGYAEPLHYREPRIEPVTIHKWKQVQKFGDLHGRVLFQGNPIGGVFVQLYDGKSSTSRADGTYTITHVPHGRYQIKAGRDLDGVFISKEEPVDIAADSTSHDVVLAGPPEQFRRLVVTGKMHIVDSEDFGPDEIADPSFGHDFYVGPFHTHDEHTFVERMGGEVRVEFRVIVDWRLDNGIDVRWEHRFFEGGSEDTNDLDGYADKNFDVPAGWWKSWTTGITSSNAGESHIEAVFDNQVNPS